MHKTDNSIPVKAGVLQPRDLPVLWASDALSIYSSPVGYAVIGKSANARRTYLSRLNQVALVFGFHSYKQLPWQLIRYEHIQYLVQYLKDQGKAHTTINTTLCAIRSVMKAAFNLQLLSGDDLTRIMNVSMESGYRLPAGRYLPSGEILSLVQACERDPAPAGIRDIAIIGLLFVCGLRRREAADLTTDSYAITENTIKFVGKRK